MAKEPGELTEPELGGDLEKLLWTVGRRGGWRGGWRNEEPCVGAGVRRTGRRRCGGAADDVAPRGGGMAEG